MEGKGRAALFVGTVLTIVLCLMCLKQTYGQQPNMAMLSGTVTDPSGAPVPGAQLVLQSTTEKRSRQTATDSVGSYIIPEILPGAYQLVVTKTGFQPTTLTGIQLSAGQGSTLNVALKLPSTITQMLVTAAPPLLETTTSSLGAEVTTKEFTELPLLGRNFTSLISILPGVSPVPNPDASYATSGVSSNAVIPSVYGQRQRDNAITVDGAPALNYSQRIGVYPPPEAVSEMKVQSGVDSGAYGWASGATVDVVTKSGTNAFHGDAWEFVRNNDLDARSFFDPEVLKYNWNQFGGAVGGPVVIPHVVSRERAWYVFGWYEGIRIRNASSYTGLVPTPDQLQGNFSAVSTPIYNPFTTVLDSSGNIVSRTPFAGNMITPTTLINPTALAIAKAIYPLPNLAPGVIPGANYFNTTPGEETANQFSFRSDHQFSSRDSFFVRYSEWGDRTVSPSLPVLVDTYPINYINFVGSETHVFNPSNLVTFRFAIHRDDITLTDVDAGDITKQLGLVSVFPPTNGVDVLPTLNLGSYAGIGEFYTKIGPDWLFTWSADAQKTAGRHSLAYGVSYMRQSIVAFQPTAEEDFGPLQTGFGTGTGDALASFLLGLPFDATRNGTTPRVDLHYATDSLYVHDTFRMTKKFTLNVGLRWDHESPPDADPGMGTIDMDNGVYYWDHRNPITGAAATIRQGIVPPSYRGFQPRLGLAYEVSPKTVVRASYGIFDNIYGIMQQSPIGAAYSWPYSFPQSEGSLNTTTPTAFIQNPFPGPAVGSTVALACNQCMNTETSSSRQPYVHEYSSSVQRQITPSLMTEVAYFGSRGVKLMGQVLDNVATVPGTDPYQDRQPWPNFPPFINNWFDEYNSWYNGLSVRLQKTYSKNLTFLLSYTWSHAIDQTDSLANGGPLGAPASNATRYNMGLFRGDAGFDIRHLFSASYVYAIPGKTGNRFVNGVIANWEVSGILSADSGVPTDVMLDFDNENIGATGRVTEFPNLVGNPEAITPTINEWFNTAAYSLPAFGTRGFAGRHAVTSDGEVNWDSMFSKRFPLYRESKSLEFRAEFFNLPNNHTFGLPDPFYGEPGFGSVSNVRQNGRQIQFALKLHF